MKSQTLSAVAFAALLAAALSPAIPAHADDATSIARIEHVCADIMKFSPGEIRFTHCVASLQQTLASIAQAADVQTQREKCAARGLAIGTSDFAHCVIDAQQIAARPR